MLQQAVQKRGADACCLLARCLYGPEYTWPGHNFPVDEQAGDELLRRSSEGAAAADRGFRRGTLDMSVVDCFENMVEIVAIAGNHRLGGNDCCAAGMYWPSCPAVSPIGSRVLPTPPRRETPSPG